MYIRATLSRWVDSFLSMKYSLYLNSTIGEWKSPHEKFPLLSPHIGFCSTWILIQCSMGCVMRSYRGGRSHWKWLALRVESSVHGNQYNPLIARKPAQAIVPAVLWVHVPKFINVDSYSQWNTCWPVTKPTLHKGIIFLGPCLFFFHQFCWVLLDNGLCDCWAPVQLWRGVTRKHGWEMGCSCR